MIEAVDGEAALGRVKQAAYDAILMYIQMPKLNGLEATRRIRALSTAEGDRIATVPIIAMTAQAMAGDREKNLAAGMNDYVTKPIDPERLAAVLTRWVEFPEDRKVAQERASQPVGAPVVPAILPDLETFNRYAAGFSAMTAGGLDATVSADSHSRSAHD